MTDAMPTPRPSAPGHILVIDDEPDLRTLYELTLLREGYQVDTAATVGEAQAQLRQARYDLVITDMRMPDGTGIDVLRGMRAEHRAERCIVITAFGSADNAVESLKAGAFDYLTKPVDLKQFRQAVAAAIHADPVVTPPVTGARTSQTPGIDAATPEGRRALQRLVGDSAAMIGVRERILKVARSMAPVLIRGESGTGKELVARALHANSHRHVGPWVAVNCGAIPENLLEAEFFGAKKGAYTGATQDRQGYFQAAHGGTLFLDEIGDLPIAMQAKLLRAIQERKVRPLGAQQEDAVDVRLVSATHKDLPAEVALGNFRQDLYYRLNVIDIAVPALRERLQDLPALCAALLARIAQDSGGDLRQLSATALEQLSRQKLPGNVRELENFLHRAVALSDGTELDMPEFSLDADTRSAPTTTPTPTIASVAAAVPVPGAGADALPNSLQSHMDAQERSTLLRALREAGYDLALAAQQLGLSLRQVRYRMARLQLEAPPLPPVVHDAH